MSWTFLTFIASIYWCLDNLVSAPLPLEMQPWGSWWSSIILYTSVDVTVLGHCSRQAEGGIKLMRQFLVHFQRLGSLIWVSNCSFWLGMDKGWFAHFQFFAGTFFWAGTLLHFNTFSWATWHFLCLGLFPTWDSWVWLCAHVAMGFHSSWTLISKYFWVFHKYLQWAFGQLVVMFETIGKVSKYFCK